MPSTNDMIQSVSSAKARSLGLANIPICEALDFVYDTLMELKHRSPWHWQVVIRAIHGLISKTKRAVNC